jgi:hypothetical protein
MKIESAPLESVTPYARNPRKNADAVAKVAASIKEYGWRQPIVVDEERVIITGHTRLMAALPLIFAFMAGRNHARSRSLAAKARAKTDQADIAARAHRHPSDILKRMRERGL